ncbi:dTDP-4-dehydrorhamnose reductase [Frateuria aurantia]
MLLLGANGQLGRTWRRQGGWDDLVCASRDGRLEDGGAAEVADLAQPASLVPLLDRVRPALIINAAAYTAVDRAESEEDRAMAVNADAVAVIGQWAAAHDARVIHYSTDYVFDGLAHSPYRESDPTGPLSAYGRSKLAGEQALSASGADHLIFRTAWVYAPWGRNFLNTMLRLAAERDELSVVDDQIGSPTSTWRIVDASLHALRQWPDSRSCTERVYHLTASGQTSWYGFACALIELAFQSGRLSTMPRIRPVTTEQFPTPARRPAWSVLDNAALQRHFHYKIENWRDDLTRIMQQS